VATFFASAIFAAVPAAVLATGSGASSSICRPSSSSAAYRFRSRCRAASFLRARDAAMGSSSSSDWSAVAAVTFSCTVCASLLTPRATDDIAPPIAPEADFTAPLAD